MTEEVIVTVNEGKIRGFKTKAVYSGVEYCSFLGVPYGQSTAGEARFKDPVKVEPWTNILDATIEREGCIQFSLKKMEITGSEDCLYNNIFTPKIPSKGDPLKAVIVNIHPGGFFHGSPDPWCYGSPDFVMHQDVVYICIGYRLHILGFLNLDLKECSGNQCLKDIILSLQWIKENINRFGGDPDNITLIGASSGSAIVHFLLLSPLGKGLYHKAILMGMYVFSPLMITLEEQTSVAYEVARKLGYDDEEANTTKLLSFYKGLDLKLLLAEKLQNFFDQTTLTIYPMYPFLASHNPRENSPLPVSPEKLIPTTNRVPVIIGFCDKEGVLTLTNPFATKSFIAQHFGECLTINRWGWGANLSNDELTFIQKQVESFYLNGESMEMAPQSILLDILTDAALSGVYASLIDVISENLPSCTYVYHFKYDGGLCTVKARLESRLPEPLKGAFHAADFNYWCCKNLKRILQPKDRRTIAILTNLFTSFAKTGDPNYRGMEVNWKPTNPAQQHHLVIDKTLETKDDLLNGERMRFWHDLKSKIKQGCNLKS